MNESINPLGIQVGDIITASWASRESYFWVKEVVIIESILQREVTWGVRAVKLRKDMLPNQKSLSPYWLGSGHLTNSRIIKRGVTL